MNADNLVGLDVCLALEPPPGGAWKEASGESILAAGLEARFRFESAIGITGPAGITGRDTADHGALLTLRIEGSWGFGACFRR